MKAQKHMVLLATVFPSLLGCASAPERGVSDHFDGRKFYNPTLEEQLSPGLGDVLGMVKEGRAKWPEFVETTGTPQLGEKLAPNGMAITFVNHATFLIQLPGVNILTDPVWSTRAGPLGLLGPKRVREPGIKLTELPRIDVVVISHNHYDHLDVETLKKLNQRWSPQFIVPVGDRELMETIGIRRIDEMDWWERVVIGGKTQIVFTPAQHSSARGLFDRDKSLWGSYFIERNGRSIYFGGDSGYSTHYTEIRHRLGSPDVALLGIGSYAPSWFMRPIHMDPAEAVAAHKDLGAKLSIGMHFGTFQLSAEAFDEPQEKLKSALDDAGLSQDRFITLGEGETWVGGS
ncbi:MBL fold metallo-hydrolase [Pleomorphomonas sp. NRK KF1]|uniref:MBL fold metallo-hydrolase n=1 Tax=Pleomorphomonas sp. NRK KF1 TaxID=2943000 RepID=UPI002044971E|nr:MBL fold metallo-hydrolase [Pleomorphomonas sp. NRK KF1]MCM5553352.1 MBL fold metallo-hydrolase [Pleomorphomonas sp. NRK KF1]